MASKGNTSNPGPHSNILESLWWLFILCASVATALWAAPPLVDDAYITFRYAHNLSDLGSLIYNPGPEKSGIAQVLGTSSPGFALFLVVLHRLGWDFEPVAFWTGLLSTLAATVMAAWVLWVPRVGRLISALIVPAVLLSYLLQAASVSGLETGLYSLIVIAVLLLLEKNNLLIAAVLASFASTLRPDGLLLVMLTLYWSLRSSRSAPKDSSLWKKYQRTALVGLVSLLILGPLAAYALHTFGAVLPHSIEAKRVIHPGSPLVNATVLTKFLTLSPSLLVFSAIGVSGLILSSIVRAPCTMVSRLALFWSAAYLCGLLFSGVRPIFFWYVSPPLLIATLLGIPAFIDFARSTSSAPPLRKAFARGGGAWLVAVLAAISIGEFAWRGRTLDQEQARHLAYHQVAKMIAPQVNPGEKVFLCETGILGYFLPQAIILDSAGLTSRELLSERRAHPTGWLKPMIERFDPDWLVSPYTWCEVSKVASERWFQDAYEQTLRISPNLLGGIVVYHKRHSPTESD